MKLLGVVFVRLPPVTQPPHAAAAGFPLWVQRAGDISQLLHGRCSAANVSSVTLSAVVES